MTPHLSQYTDTGHDTPPRHSIQTQDMTPHPSQYTDTGHDTPPVTVYRHGADLSVWYPLMWNVTLEYTTTHPDVLGQTQSGNPSPTFQTHQQTCTFMMLLLWQSVRSLLESVPYPPSLEQGTCGMRIHYAIRSCCFSSLV